MLIHLAGKSAKRRPGSTIRANLVTLPFVDGGPGATDGVANGLIVDPGGPGDGTITIPCDNGISGGGWTVFQTGGATSGQGTVTYNSTTAAFVVTEGNSFDTGLKHDFVIPTAPNILTFDYANLSFDTTTTGRIKDAFEVAFVDANGTSLVQTIAPGRNAFFNITDGLPPALAPGVTLQNGTVNLDISTLFAGTTGTLVFRLVNNDGDIHSTVSLSCHPGPGVTIALANDTAPTGPGSDPYRTDLLTNDPTVTGTATDAAGITKLEASVDGGAYSDITTALNVDQYTWYPGALAHGSHTVSIRATDAALQVTTASLTFRVNVPPLANAGGNQTVTEGSLGTFDGSASSDTEATLFGYRWTFPDGSTASGPYAGYPFVQPGSYPVTLAVTDTAGSVVTDTATVTVANLPPVVAGIPDQVIPEAGTATFQTTFTDAGTLDTHTASITWGDGATSAGTVSEANGSGTVTGSHVYDEEGTYTATVTVTDNGGAAGSAAFVVTVNDAPPTLTLSGAASVAEGTAYVLTLGATPGPDPVLGWTIHWGDGTTSTPAAGATSASHVYADGPTQVTITATGTTDDGTLNANALVVTVNNLPPTLSISGAASVNEGSTYTLTLSGTPDAWDADPITAWQIAWGDGSTQQVSGNPSSVTHTYLDGPSARTIAAWAIDDDGSYATNTVAVTVNNVAPTVTANNVSGNEGQSLSFFGTFADPGVLDTHTATIAWGDNSSSTGTVTEQNGSGAVTGSHVYADNGSYTITLSVTDKDNATTSRTATATSANVAPTATAAADLTEVPNVSFTATLASFSDPGFTSATAGTVETFTASINWGDGSANSAGTVSVTQGVPGALTIGSVAGTHSYLAAGDYTVTVTVTDDDGGSGNCHLVIHVPSHGAAKFYVVDQSTQTNQTPHRVFAYDAAGNPAGSFDLSANNQRPWGIATNAALSRLWIVAGNGNLQVYVYKPDGTLVGNWIADTVTSAQDIATDGGNLWILDNAAGKVDFFAGGAGLLGGHHAPSSSFLLDPADQAPTGMVTDGSTVWVTDDHANTNNVFVYNTSGRLLGVWALDPADHTPTGITLNPNYPRGTATDLWTVDRATATVYRYAGGSTWTSGNHTAASTFALDAHDQHAEGITDPTVMVQTPAAGSTFPAGDPYLVSGTATPDAGATLRDVTVNGSGATVDAGGDFFQQLTAGLGGNPVSVTGTDSAGPATASLTVTGAAPLTASPSNPGAIDFSLLSDVTASMSVSYARTSFNHGSSVLYADFTAANHGSYTIGTPLLVGVRHVSAPSVRVRGNTGRLPDGTPFYDLSSLVTGTTPPTLGPGQGTQTATLSFYDPEGVPFTYDLVFLGRLNHPPRFTSVPVVTVMAGEVYRYTTTAADPDGDYLTFSVAAGPPALAFTDSHAGTLTWATATSDAGTYPVRLRVNDNRGGSADQTFILSVIPAGMNYPPYFTSTPATAASVNSLYTYAATAADLDNDAHTFSLINGPAGMTVNPTTGLVQWTPAASLLGTQTSVTVPVKLQVTDTAQVPLSSTQSYNILLQPAAGNHPPIFVTTPVTSVAAGAFYVYPSRAIDPDGDTVSYALLDGPGSMVIDPDTGQVTWPTTAANAGNSYPVTLLASDGRGGTATQSFTVTVTAAGPALAALFGTKYNDLNGNGQRDPLNPAPTGLTPIRLQQAAIADTPYALDYHQPTNSMMIVGSHNGSTPGIYRVQPDGSELLYASLPGLTLDDGTSMATVRAGNSDGTNPGFTEGDIFVAGTSTGFPPYPAIVKVTDGGATVVNPWVTLPTNGRLVALVVDTTGAFGDQLLALVLGGSSGASGELWKVDATGHPSRLATLSGMMASEGTGENGLLVVPNNPAQYGPLAGQVLILSDARPAVTVSPGGIEAFPQGPPPSLSGFGPPSSSGTGLDAAEGAAIVTPGTNLVAIADGTPSISVADGSPFGAIPGQIVVAHEGLAPGFGWFDRVWWDGTYLQTAQLAFTPDSVTHLPWYEDAFAPVGLGPVPLPLEPGLPNWTIYLDSNHNGQLDAGEPSTITDAAGHYAFVNLTPGNYTVAEVPQAGWTQKGPAPVPPGTYTKDVAAGQEITGLDFGNQRNATPPPPPDPVPPSDTPDPAPYFTNAAPNPATATVGIPFLYPATATDPDGGVPLTFDLPVHPAGMAVDPQLGVVAWQPTPDQAGLNANVLLRVTDTQGSVALQWFTVTVTGTNTPPVITSTPGTTATFQLPYQYQVQAQDADHDPLTYAVSSSYAGPNPPQIDPNTGLLTWTPQVFRGSVTLTVSVSDGQNDPVTQTYTLTIVSFSTNQPPVISSTPRTTIALGQTYLYALQASDPDSDPLTYSLPAHPAGMNLNPSTGLVVWTPAAAQFGANSVQVQVSDGRGGTATQSFTVNVTDQAVNHAPVITSSPAVTATVGELYYAYDASASDPDGDPFAWKLLTAPRGMSLNPNLGTVRWTPAPDQEGSQTVTLQVVDPYGGSATQTWIINVPGANQPPAITSTPPEQAQVGQLYSYAIGASDPDGDALSYTVSGFPGMASVTSAGLLTGTSFAPTTATITVTVSDGHGGTATQTYPLTVSNAPTNYPPVITSTAPAATVSGVAYSYALAVSDPDNDARTYALSTTYTGGGGPTINVTTGLVSWPSPVAGIYQFTLTVTDAGGLQAVQVYTLTVRVNHAPAITSAAVTSVTAGLPYRYDVQASDDDGDVLTFALSGAPSWLSIDQDGRISGAPGIAQIGTYSNILVTVTDPFGGQATQTFTLTVQADTQPPAVELQLSTNPLNLGQQETFLVFASDNVGVASLTLTVNGTNLDIDSSGQAFSTPAAAGTYTVVATATDAAGNTASSTQTLVVTNPNGTPPAITLTTPALDANITAPVAVTGTVSDDHIGVRYTVTVIPFDGSPPRQIGSGSTTTANSLSLSGVTFDPTLLANGDYTIEVKATDTDDNRTTTLDRHVSVSGHLKLGRETLSVTDLTIPVAGVPISIIRSYDSLDAGKSMDFGYGWRLSFGDAQLTVDLVDGAGIGWGGYPAFLYGTRVYVTMPGGDREGYTFKPYQAAYDSFGLITYWHPYFEPDPGVLDQLTAPDALLDLDPASGEYYAVTDSGIDTYNPADPNFGGTYTVTNLTSLGSTIDATSGKLLSVKARNGNALTFSDMDITSNTGKKVTFTRDPAGHITAITDPRGNSVKYAYDVNGNLVSVTDRVGDPPAQYTYDPNHAHYLASVVDPLGVQQLHVAYDTNGRMTQMADAVGDPMNFSYDTTALTETVTDPNLPAGSQSATVTFDARGNPKQALDLTGAQSLATYNNTQPAAKDLPDTVTQVKRNPDGSTTSYTTQLTYDSKGEPTSTTDPAGAVTHITYGPFGETVTSSDPLGNTVTNSYDSNGNLLSTLTAAGVATYFTYDQHNNLTAVSRGMLLVPPPGGPTPPAAATLYTYDSFGYRATSTSPTSVTMKYSYDANGNPTGTSFTWVNPNNPAQTQVITTAVVFDANDRPTQTIDVYGHATITHYDLKGGVTESDDVLGNPTQYVLDARDQVVQTTFPNGAVSDTVYDAEGRGIYAADPHVPGQADVHGTHTIYDSFGRVKETDRLDNTVISVTTTNGVSSSQLVSAGTVLSSTKSTYNDLGQVTSSTDAANQTTYYQYQANGRQTAVTDPLNETSYTGYDAAGRQLITTDALGNVTRSVLDPDGKALKTIFADGTFTATAYDSQGRQSGATDQLGRPTQYQDDPVGHLTAVVLPPVLDPAIGTMVNPTTNYAYDAYGNLTSITDAEAHTTQFTFDPFGHQLRRTLPLGQTETTTYDSYAREATHTDFKGLQEVFHYDALGRLDTKTFYAAGSSTPGETVVYHFDALGRNDTVTDTIGSTQQVTSYAFDLDNRITAVSTPQGTVNYEYDPATGHHTRTYTTNTDIRYAYDELGRLQTVTVIKRDGITLTAPEVTTYHYNAVGEVDQVTGATGVITANTFDVLNNLLAVTHTVPGGAVLARYVYTRDAEGRITNVAESNGSGLTGTEQYSYDALGRLMHEAYDGIAAGTDYATVYSYDLVGNRLAKTTTFEDGHIEQVISHYNAGDWLTSADDYVNGSLIHTTTYGYDANGSLTSQTTPGVETLAYHYDLRGQLAGATIDLGNTHIDTAYQYNDAGLRVRTTETTTVSGGTPSTNDRLLLVDANNPTGYDQVIEVRMPSGVLLASFVYGLEPLSESQAGVVGYYLLDGHSGVRLLLSPTNATLATYRYDSFGGLIAMNGTIANPLLYRGEWFDAILGQYYLRARFYDGLTGRFTTVDPIAGDQSNPLTLHRYLYAAANPIQFVDPSGKDFLLDIQIGIYVRTQMFAMQHPVIFGVLQFGFAVLNLFTFATNEDYRIAMLAACGGDPYAVAELLALDALTVYNGVNWAEETLFVISGASFLSGHNEYEVANVAQATASQNELLAFYRSNCRKPSIDVIEGLEGATIDPVTGSIKISKEVAENYPNLVDGYLMEELHHFKQLYSRGWYGRTLTQAETKLLEDEIPELMKQSGFGVFDPRRRK